MRESTHLRLSILLLAGFVALGLVLEGLYGLRRAQWMDDELGRELLRLGHAHGGMLALLNLVLAWAMMRLRTPEAWAARVRIAAWSGALLVGFGFAGGGLWHGPTDPGPLVLLVPAGASMVLTALVAVAWLRAREQDPEHDA